MKKSRKSLMTSLLIATAFSGGCIDAVGTGFAAGVDGGISAVVEGLISTTLTGLLPDSGAGE